MVWRSKKRLFEVVTQRVGILPREWAPIFLWVNAFSEQNIDGMPIRERMDDLSEVCDYYSIYLICFHINFKGLNGFNDLVSDLKRDPSACLNHNIPRPSLSLQESRGEFFLVTSQFHRALRVMKVLWWFWKYQLLYVYPCLQAVRGVIKSDIIE